MILEENVATTNYVILEDNSQYSYTVHPFELRNALGNIVAVLKEFVFTKSQDSAEHNCYKLYQTKEGNWYDIADLKSPVEYNLLRRLKTAMDMKKTP